MGYYLQAVICKIGDAETFKSRFEQAKEVELAQGLCLIPITEELFDQLTDSTESPGIGRFEYLNQKMEDALLMCFPKAHFAYVEAEYNGGQGAQEAIIWQNGKRTQILDSGDGRINQVLQNFGVVASNGHDEFDSLGFGRHRFTKYWLVEGS
ncbi:hypothetical protein [Spirosoma litoris]